MSTIHLHIGTEKTGTTTIQRMLARNRLELLRQGYVYPESSGRINHVRLALYASAGENKDLFLNQIGSVSEPDKSAFREDFPKALAAELQEFPDKQIIFSNEHCSSRLNSAEELTRLQALLAPHAQSIKIIIYLRRQDEVSLSLYSTWIKAGIDILPTASVLGHGHWFDYANLLDRWAECFGKENILVRIFDRSQFKNGVLEDDFLDSIGLTDTGRFRYPRAQNVSLDRVRLEFLRKMNSLIPRIEADKLNPKREGLLRLLSQVPADSGKKLALPDEEMDAIIQRYDDSNARVARQYLGRQDGILFGSERAESAGEPYRELSVDEAMQITAELWCLQQEAGPAGLNPARMKGRR